MKILQIYSSDQISDNVIMQQGERLLDIVFSCKQENEDEALRPVPHSFATLFDFLNKLNHNQNEAE